MSKSYNVIKDVFEFAVGDRNMGFTSVCEGKHLNEICDRDVC